ncbi:uncharacterized protein A4U43_C04F4710 [Asparagus officinalis]|uniref:CID domain-containing protein n=1 Tax=Asparagus officinalis TaxID=4686 RepID=A0A5P1F2S9_ASPOF|nr:uncharacterized protein A4U43_C04F4710 [Asparagus officinalis]
MDVMYKVGDRKVVRLMVMLLANLTQLDSGTRSLLQNAEQVVQTWDKQFHSAQKEQKVPLLYLANDILQNSKRTGSEFVGEFWKVLPAAVKVVMENGDDHGKNVVSRLVRIFTFLITEESCYKYA